MSSLSTLSNSHRGARARKRVGRGIGSGHGKTSGRGQKGAKARSGYKRRHGNEGGQVRLSQKLPGRGFSNARFRKELDIVNLGQIDSMFQEGETVNMASLRERGYIAPTSNGVKVLSVGKLTKGVTIEVHAVSERARNKIEKSKATLKIVS